MISPKRNDPSFFQGRGELEPHSIVFGMRNWRVRDDGHLSGVIYSEAVWEPGENAAVCWAVEHINLPPHHPVYWYGPPARPHPIDHSLEACHCGFYAYYDGSRDYNDYGSVTGVIKGWGEGVVGDKGFRVTRAEIVALKFSRSILPEVRDRVVSLYDVPVFSTVKAMLAEFPTTAGDLEYVPEADDEFWTREA